MPSSNHLVNVVLLAFSLGIVIPSVYADRRDDFEFTVQVPYLLGDEIKFKGGASADINDDPGFGFGIGYNFSEHFALRGNMGWNQVSYDAVRILDGGVATTRQSVRGNLDTFTIGMQGDYYITEGGVAPFVSGSLGWTTVDTNIADGPPSTVCWWDPWYGYICGTAQSTYTESYWYYGLGAGLRIDFNRNSFMRVSYQVKWLDVDEAKDTTDFASVVFEFGFSY